MRMGFNSGDLTFYANKYGDASTANVGEFFISGSYFVAQSIDFVSYPTDFVKSTGANAPSEFASGTQKVDYYQYQNSAGTEVHMQVLSYYTGADSDLWKIFDGDMSSSVKVQEPDLLWEGEQVAAKVHSVTLYTTSSGNSYTAYWRTSDFVSSAWSTGTVQSATANWVQVGSYYRWELPIKATTMKLEIHLRGSGLDFDGAPDGASHATRSFEFSGFEVNLRHSVTTTSVTATVTSTTKSRTQTTTTVSTSTITATTTTVTAYPSVAFDELSGYTCSDTPTSSGLTSATLDACKLACFSSSTCKGFVYTATGGSVTDNCQLLATVASVSTSSTETCYLRVAQGMCPYSYQYAFYVNSDYCCKTNKEKDDGSGASCDGSALHASGTVSMCCEGDDFQVCENPPCADYQSYTSATMHGTATISYVALQTTTVTTATTTVTTATATVTSTTVSATTSISTTVTTVTATVTTVTATVTTVTTSMSTTSTSTTETATTVTATVTTVTVSSTSTDSLTSTTSTTDSTTSLTATSSSTSTDSRTVTSTTSSVTSTTSSVTTTTASTTVTSSTTVSTTTVSTSTVSTTTTSKTSTITSSTTASHTTTATTTSVTTTSQSSTSSTTTFMSPRYLYWDTVTPKLSTELFRENDAYLWTVIFVSTGSVRLKNVGTSSYLAVSGSSLVLETAGSSAGLWAYVTDAEGLVTLKNSDADKYLCTNFDPDLQASCSGVNWIVSLVTNSVSASVFTSVTATSTSLTGTTTTVTSVTATETRTSVSTTATSTLTTYTVTATWTTWTSTSISSTKTSTITTTVVTATTVTATLTMTTTTTATAQFARTRLDLSLKSGRYYISHYLHECHSDTSLTKNVWQHVAFVYDSVAKTQKIYIDGALDKTCTDIDSLNADDSNKFYLGGAVQRGVTATWTGSLADVNIFLEVLTLNQVSLARLSACYLLPGTDCRAERHAWHMKGTCLVSADVSGLSPKTCSQFCGTYGLQCLKAAAVSSSGSCSMSGSDTAYQSQTEYGCTEVSNYQLCECYSATWPPALVNPASTARTYSSSTNGALGALDDTSGVQMWSPDTTTDEYMIIDVGSNNHFVCGVVSQGSGSTSNWVQSFEVDISEDSTNYVPIAGVFPGNVDAATHKVTKFPLPMRARYVRLWPASSQLSTFAMRAGLVTCGPLRAGKSANLAPSAGITCDSSVSSCGSAVTDGTKCTDASAYSGALATATAEFCTSQYWVQLDLGHPLASSPFATPTKLVNKVVLFGCEGLMYCGRKLETSSDGSTWATVREASTYYDDETAPTAAYDEVEGSYGTIFVFDLRAVRYVKVWSSFSESDTKVHFAEIEVYEEAPELSYQFDTELSSTKVTMGNLNDLGLASGDYTFMTYWNSGSLTANSQQLD
ncbi:unnamed protein product, partial [Effrenium voratum]